MTASSQVAEASSKYLAEAAGQVVAAGYKQTEVGVIPETWLVQPLSILTEQNRPISYGIVQTGPNIDNGIPCLRVVDIVGGKINKDNFITTTKVISNSYKRTILREGDLVIPLRGKVGEVGLIDSALSGANLTRGVALVALQGGYEPKFIKQYLSSEKTANRLLASMNGSALQEITIDTLRKFSVAIPDLKEQTAIANALSDVDALINELEKLIAKKQAIKTATMQQLLTGRTRLPQFALQEDGTQKGYKQSELGEIPEDWEYVNFAKLFEISFTRKTLKSSDTISFVGMQDVTENAQLSNATLIRYSEIKSGFTYFEKGDVLVAKITPCFENGKGCHTATLPTEVGYGSTEFHVLRAKDNSDPRFIYFWTTRNTFRITLESEMVGSAGHRRVPFSAIQKYLIPSPKSKEEQTSIATILSDMDVEIHTLQQRLSKTRQIKQGMMQELLTGRTRLVKPEVAV